MAQWFAEIDGSETGPITSAELKELASKAIVTPDTKVRIDGSRSWSIASKIKGLTFPSNHTPNEAHQISPPAIPVSVASESQGDRECPFCFETIKAKAEKCRHCGEFLKANKPKTPSVNRVETIANRQRHLLLFILVSTFFAGPMLLILSSIDPFLFFFTIFVLDVGWIIIAMSLSFSCYEEKSVGAILSILTILPLVGWIFVLIINGKATSILKANGMKVGLLGATK
jgi:hypothetical protein